MPSETTTTTTTTESAGGTQASSTITSSSTATSSPPPSAATLEAEIYKHLSETSALDDLHAELLFSLQRAGWTERIQTLTLDLLRAGRCSQFDDLVDVVVALAAGESHPAVPEADGNSNNPTTNGHATTNGASNGGGPGPYFANLDVRIPKEVVDQGVRALKESIRPIATIEGDEDPTEAENNNDTNTTADSASKSKKDPGKTSTKDSRLKNPEASPSKNAAAAAAAAAAAKDKKAKIGGK